MTQTDATPTRLLEMVFSRFAYDLDYDLRFRQILEASPSVGTVTAPSASQFSCRAGNASCNDISHVPARLQKWDDSLRIPACAVVPLRFTLSWAQIPKGTSESHFRAASKKSGSSETS